jgi:hypothetical protein
MLLLSIWTKLNQLVQAVSLKLTQNSTNMSVLRILKLVFSLLLIPLLGCVATPWKMAKLEEIQTAADPKVSTLPAYDLTAAQWVPDQPILVNKDFNFGMAMSIEGVGVAIAAGMRINKNKELAASLSALPPLNLNQRWQSVAIDVQLPWRDKRVVIYAMLYGQPQAQLRTIVEFHNGENPPERFMDVSDWLPVDGEASWAAMQGARLFAQIDESLAAIAVMVVNDSTAVVEEQDYTISGGEAAQRGRGYIKDQREGRVVLQSTNIPNTTIRFPAHLFTSSVHQEAPL